MSKEINYYKKAYPIFVDSPISGIVTSANQSRIEFDDEKIAGLAQSIREIGLVQPITLIYMAGTGDEANPIGQHLQLIAGERRLRAWKKINEEDGVDNPIPSVIIGTVLRNQVQSKEEVFKKARQTLIENIQREPL